MKPICHVKYRVAIVSLYETISHGLLSNNNLVNPQNMDPFPLIIQRDVRNVLGNPF